MSVIEDDLGRPVGLQGRPERLVSLVPSLTEALATTVPELLVGATDWCTHTEGLDPPRVRGTKNPDLAAIRDLRPDLVIANREENRRIDVERLEESGIRVWVTDIDSLDQAFASLRRLFGAVLGGEPPAWLTRAEREWAAPPELPPLQTLAPVWRDPWMAIGARTFSGDLIGRLGLVNLLAAGADRYPKLRLTELRELGPELVLLPDEPYPFSATDGPDAFAGTATALVEGRALTWYGPSLVTARRILVDRISEVIEGS